MNRMYEERKAAAGPRAHWAGVWAMTLCVFVLIASEFMPVSLLTPLAASLRVSEGAAGQGIAISAAFAVLTSLLISTLAGWLDRRTVLLALTALMGLSGALIALAPSYAVYMVGRALIGVVVGGFWSLSAATAMRLVPHEQVPRALALFNGGNALATVVAAPLGSALGALVGWRGTFLALVPLAVIGWFWQRASLPPMKVHGPRPGRGALPGLLRQRQVALGMLAVGLFFMGQFTLFTYVRPYLETVTRVDARTVSLMLLAVGVGGLVGTAAVGPWVRRHLYRTLALIPLLMTGIALALMGTGPQPWRVGLLLGAWGLVATAAPVGWWTWIARAMPAQAEAGGALMVAVVQLAIGLGSTLGGVLFDALGYRATFGTSALLLVLASVLTGVAARADAPRNPTASDAAGAC